MNSNKYREDGLGHKSRVPFNDVLEAAIYFDDQTVQIEQLAARTGITTAMFSFKKKPTKVVLDPRMLFLDAFPGDNERAVTLE